MTMLRNFLLIATLTLTAMLSSPAGAQNWTQVGTLSCKVDPNIGFIIVGHQPMQCVYNQAPGSLPQVPPQSYDGAINTIGLSIGISAGSVLGWAVFAPTTGMPAGARQTPSSPLRSLNEKGRPEGGLSSWFRRFALRRPRKPSVLPADGPLPTKRPGCDWLHRACAEWP